MVIDGWSISRDLYSESREYSSRTLCSDFSSDKPLVNRKFWTGHKSEQSLEFCISNSCSNIDHIFLLSPASILKEIVSSLKIGPRHKVFNGAKFFFIQAKSGLNLIHLLDYLKKKDNLDWFSVVLILGSKMHLCSSLGHF